MYSNEAKIYTTLLIAAVVLALILTFFIISLLKQHKKNIQLHREKLLAEINTLEKERRRVAADLHDEIGPLLSVVKMQISSLDNCDAQNQQLVDNAGKYIDDILVRMRGIAVDLMPSVLLRKGLVTAIQEYVSHISLSGKMQISCSANTATLLLDNNSEIHLYRIVQEIINNSIKHAGASHINISIQQTTILTITISDDGKGFSYVAAANKQGFGLRNIASRAEILNGTLYFDSAPGKGVTYTIEIPLTNIHEQSTTY